jgi:hypothetical protein
MLTQFKHNDFKNKQAYPATNQKNAPASLLCTWQNYWLLPHSFRISRAFFPIAATQNDSK